MQSALDTYIWKYRNFVDFKLDPGNCHYVLRAAQNQQQLYINLLTVYWL